MGLSQDDHAHMQRALELASRARGRTSPNPMVGAVVVRDGRVIGEGYHHKAGLPHAEVNAIADAGDCTGATLYVTLEPCCHHGRTPPCSQAVISAGFTRVVAAMADPHDKVAGKGFEQLRAAGIEVEVGCCETEAMRLNEHFITYHKMGRPFVTLKWAMTLDGRTSADSGDSKWITGEASRHRVHELRAQHDAILTGIGTVLADDPQLNVRQEKYDGPQPLRVILDSKLSIPETARLLADPEGGGVMIIVADGNELDSDKRGRIEAMGHRVESVASINGQPEIGAVMQRLAEEKCLSVFVEGGRRVHTSMLAAGVADKVYAFMASKIIGGREFTFPVGELGSETMADAIRFRETRWIGFGDDICFEGYVDKTSRGV